MNDIVEIILKGILLLIISVIIEGFLISLLWNALLPHLFGAPEISFLEALGLSILSSCFFKNNIHYRKDD